MNQGKDGAVKQENPQDSEPARDNDAVPDFVELWKQMYFKTEESWTSSIKEFITTKYFITMLEQARDQYLSYHKVSEQNLDKYFQVNPVPSKKDIARVAELIIGLEDKVDDLDIQFSGNINRITGSLIKLVDFQSTMRDEITALRQQAAALSAQLDGIEKKLEQLGSAGVKEKEPENKKPGTRKRTAKVDTDT